MELIGLECIRTLSRGGMYWVVHPRRPRDVPRAKLEEHLEGRGKSRGRRGFQPYTSRLEAVYGHFLIINPYQGMYQEIHPCMAGSIDTVKINTSLLMMREWIVNLRVG